MEGHIFVGILEDWIGELTRKSGDKKRARITAPNKSDPVLLPEDLEHFKSWFSLAMRITEVWSEGISMRPEDVVFNSAIKRTHSRLLEALSMFSDKELLDLFGSERASQIRGLANEATFTPTPTETVLVRPPVDISGAV